MIKQQHSVFTHRSLNVKAGLSSDQEDSNVRFYL